MFMMPDPAALVVRSRGLTGLRWVDCVEPWMASPAIGLEASMQAGDKLSGRYALHEQLGHGGMGEVWLGVDEWLGRPVAVKVLREHLADPEGVARFRREATIGARLQHPGITVVHDVGADNGQLFIVMELLRGRDLAAMLAEAPDGLPVDAAVSHLLQVAEALQAAHRGGVIHRDLKPGNLFVLDSGQLKICDFGIARAVDSTTRLTAVGHVIGTFAYMSPEQCRGERVDERSDLYSLGCVLYELLTGRLPFGAGEPLALMNLHVNVAPAAPRTIRPDIPPELDHLVMELLAKDPARRPANASHVIAASRALCYTPTVKVELTTNSAARPDLGSPERTGQATGLVPNGPDRAAQRIAAARLIADMERTARFIRDHSLKARVLAEIATALAATRPDDAERLAQLITGEYWRATILPGIARALTATGPDRAVRLIAAAERDMQSIAEKSGALAEIAKALAAIDPDRAEHVAGSIGGPSLKARVLAEIAAAQASTDPVRAARLTAASEHIARSVTGESSQLLVLTEIAKVLAVADPDRAERIARSLADESSQAYVLAGIAKVLAATDPIRAARLTADAEYLAQFIADERSKSRVLAEIAIALAATDPDRAERIARSVTDKSWQASTLAGMAMAVAATDPDRAERIARSITDKYWMAWTFVRLVQAWSSDVERCRAAKERPARPDYLDANQAQGGH
jgi:eukaryotic-like serine/threonine-protein kinase